ncbi:MAG TPA: phosphoribosyltransferase family protein [Vicinamibacteria bacterium]|nr:phosphoribosyltransferase family protein [Vicinamibacteria bacterium]
MRDEVAVLYTEEEIARRVAELGAEIGRALEGRELNVLGLMGSLIFMADLVRHLPLETSMHLVRVSTQREQTANRVMTEIVFATAVPLEGCDVLLVDDVVDTGITLSYLLGHLHERRPRSVHVCTLIDKPELRKIDVHPDWAAFALKEDRGRFLVGYGLDWKGRFAGLPFLGTIARPSSGPRTAA